MRNNSIERSPRLVAGTDIRALPIGPEEAFVLSRVDGINSEEDLVNATGFTSEAIRRIVDRLVELKAIEFVATAPHRSIERGPAFPRVSSGAYRIEASRKEDAAPKPPQAAVPMDPPRTPGESGQYVRSVTSIAPASRSSEIDARRKALARKLSQSSMRPVSGIGGGDVPGLRSLTPGPSNTDELAEPMRQQQAAHYVSFADDAAEHSDLTSAINSMKIAASIAPNDETIAAKLKSLQARVAAEYWRDHAEKAEFELYGRRYSEAARLFELAAHGHPCWRFFERAAYCCLHSGGDLKKAAELAKRAITLGPDVAKCHFTLAQVYVAAKLKESALAELERAHSLDPNQEAVREYMRLVRRGDF